jgi:galactarate dehydratase
MDPRLIRVHPADNVAIVVDHNGLPAGTVFPGGLVLREAVPQSHKVALHDIGPGAPVLRYGTPIAFAARAIPGGAWVREELLEIPPAPELDELPLATAVPPPQPPLEGFTFEATPTPMEPSAHATSWPSPRPCSASRRR